MEFDRLSNVELLTHVVGKRDARELTDQSLKAMFEGATERVRTRAKLLAAKELVKRYLFDSLEPEAILSKPDTVRQYLVAVFAGLEHEVFYALFLDSQHHLIASEELFRGTLAQTSVYPREVVKRALRHNAASIVFAHNHPSGVAEPSRA